MTDSACYGSPSEEIQLAPGTNQITGLVEFCPGAHEMRKKHKKIFSI